MKKVLLVEDDDLLQGMYQRVLSMHGFEVEVASDGEEGIKKVFENTPDVILLDIMMPKINGLNVLKEIKASPQTKHIPVMVLTNLAGDQFTQRAMTLGAENYVIKSNHDPMEIIQMVKDLVKEA